MFVLYKLTFFQFRFKQFIHTFLIDCLRSPTTIFSLSPHAVGTDARRYMYLHNIAHCSAVNKELLAPFYLKKKKKMTYDIEHQIPYFLAVTISHFFQPSKMRSGKLIEIPRADREKTKPFSLQNFHHFNCPIQLLAIVFHSKRFTCSNSHIQLLIII